MSDDSSVSVHTRLYVSVISPVYDYTLMDFRHTFVVAAFRDKDELIRFWGQKVKDQGHIMVVEASST